MKPLLLLFFLATAAFKSSTTVYICGSGKTNKYHLKSNCRGLSNCSYKIIKTTLEKATKDKKTLCGWEK
jgi:5-bromo-4-chloroindolyl phosphate hydrolysis protein